MCSDMTGGHCQVEVDYPKLMPNMPGSRQDSSPTSSGSVNRVFVNLIVPSISQGCHSREISTVYFAPFFIVYGPHD